MALTLTVNNNTLVRSVSVAPGGTAQIDIRAGDRMSLTVSGATPRTAVRFQQSRDGAAWSAFLSATADSVGGAAASFTVGPSPESMYVRAVNP